MPSHEITLVLHIAQKSTKMKYEHKTHTQPHSLTLANAQVNTRRMHTHGSFHDCNVVVAVAVKHFGNKFSNAKMQHTKYGCKR